MRIVNNYVMDGMDVLVEAITSNEKVKKTLKEALDNAYYGFTHVCESREDGDDDSHDYVCYNSSSPTGKCLAEDCPHMKKVEKEDA